MIRVPQYSEQFQQMFQGQEVPAAGIVLAVAVLSGVVGLVLIGLAFAVYRGSRAGIIAAIVICALALLYAMVNVIVISVAGGTVAGGLPAVACSLILQTVPPLWLLIWLVSALQSTGQLQLAQSQYQAQYWQYLQRQQAYQQHPPQPPGSSPPPPISRPQ
jgi:ABC-type transport system involved in multi-copper enzyme maturation permease subunit